MNKIKPLTFLTLVITMAVIGSWSLANISQTALAVSEDDIIIEKSDQQLILTVNGTQLEYAENVNTGDCNNDLDEGLLNSLELVDEQAVLSFVEKDSTQTYCFRLTDADGLTAWKTFQILPQVIIDLVGPTIRVTKTKNNVITISANDLDLKLDSWRYGNFSNNPNCENAHLSNAFPSRRSNTLALRESDNGNWYCFKAEDVSDNASFFKYRVTGVDTTGPEIIINQNGRLLTATSQDGSARSWIYVFSPSDINCDAGTFFNNRSSVRSNQVTLTSDRIDYYYCFRAMDEVGNWGYKEYQVESVDFLASKITLKQNGSTINIVSDNPINRWHYIKATSQIECNAEADFANATELSNSHKIKLRDEDNQQYFCVRGINSTNTASFARLKVNLVSLEITLEVDDDSIFAKAEGDDLTWEYLKTENELDCDEGDLDQFKDINIDKHTGKKSQLTKLDNDYWFCFRAVDEFGNSAYAKKQISGITKEAPGDSQESSNNEVDIIIITSVLIIISVGFVVYVFWEKKKQFKAGSDPDSTPQTPVKKKRILSIKLPKKQKSESAQETDAPEDEIIQPLDYLKKDKDK